MLSKEAKVFFTKNGAGTVNVVHADGNGRKQIYAIGERLIGLAIDSKQR